MTSTVAAGCSFHVPGIAVPQGSHDAIPVRMKGGRVRAVVRQQNDQRHRAWRWAVRTAAEEAWRAAAPLLGPVGVELCFYRPRPAAHWTARGELSAEGRRYPYPTAPPDLDKLTRSVGDSLTGVIYRDDSQIVHLHVEKRWRQAPGVHVTVWLYADEAR